MGPWGDSELRSRGVAVVRICSAERLSSKVNHKSAYRQEEKCISGQVLKPCNHVSLRPSTGHGRVGSSDRGLWFVHLPCGATVSVRAVLKQLWVPNHLHASFPFFSIHHGSLLRHSHTRRNLHRQRMS